LFRENLGSKRDVRVNLRSSGQVDVNKVAQAFGGGGHKTAAGCTVIGKLSNVRRKVLTKLKESLS
jgi:phosphoesterase RecJ-like protein